ncbi:hypothetical protein A5849_001498, partial [Enterococcus sp. 10F3_DIV0382]
DRQQRLKNSKNNYEELKFTSLFPSMFLLFPLLSINL